MRPLTFPWSSFGKRRSVQTRTRQPRFTQGIDQHWCGRNTKTEWCEPQAPRRSSYTKIKENQNEQGKCILCYGFFAYHRTLACVAVKIREWKRLVRPFPGYSFPGYLLPSANLWFAQRWCLLHQERRKRQWRDPGRTCALFTASRSLTIFSVYSPTSLGESCGSRGGYPTVRVSKIRFKQNLEKSWWSCLLHAVLRRVYGWRMMHDKATNILHLCGLMHERLRVYICFAV